LQEVQEIEVEESAGGLEVRLKGVCKVWKRVMASLKSVSFELREHGLGGDVLVGEAVLAGFEFFDLSADLAMQSGDAVEVFLEGFGGGRDAGFGRC